MGNADIFFFLFGSHSEYQFFIVIIRVLLYPSAMQNARILLIFSRVLKPDKLEGAFQRKNLF